MGCSTSELAESEPPKNMPKIDKVMKALEMDGGLRRDEVGEMEMKCAELEAELQDLIQEIHHLKTGEALSSRNSLKLNRKYTFHEAPGMEDALGASKASLAELEAENVRLKEMLRDQTHHFSSRSEEVMDLQSAVDEIKCELARIGARNQRLLKEKVLLMFCTSLEVNMLLAVALWRHSNGPTPARSTLDSTTDIERMTSEKEELIQSSPLSLSLSKVDFTTVRSMSRTSVVLLFENLMDEKYEQDIKDLMAGRPIKSHTDFLMEYMNRRHGLPAVASKKLAQFAMGLAGTYTAGNPYAKIMCGVFSVGKQDPMHPSFATYLTHIRAIFNTLKDKRRRPVGKTASSPHSPLKADFRKEKLNNVELAGSAPLVFVCELIYALFKDLPSRGEFMLGLIKPVDLPIEDFIIFKICHKMAQDGCSPEDLFKRLDRDHGGTIDVEEFHDGIKQLMSMWLSDTDLSLAMQRLAPAGGEITREQFFKRINFDAYYNSLGCREFLVSGVNFLLAFVELHNQVQQECKDAFERSASRDEVEFVEFQTALMEFDRRLTHPDTVKIYNSITVERLDLKAFLAICQNEYLGSFRLFGTLYSDHRNLEAFRSEPDPSRIPRRKSQSARHLL